MPDVNSNQQRQAREETTKLIQSRDSLLQLQDISDFHSRRKILSVQLKKDPSEIWRGETVVGCEVSSNTRPCVCDFWR